MYLFGRYILTMLCISLKYEFSKFEISYFLVKGNDNIYFFAYDLKPIQFFLIHTHDSNVFGDNFWCVLIFNVPKYFKPKM
jgi:hypothetical protein